MSSTFYNSTEETSENTCLLIAIEGNDTISQATSDRSRDLAAKVKIIMSGSGPRQIDVHLNDNVSVNCLDGLKMNTNCRDRGVENVSITNSHNNCFFRCRLNPHCKVKVVLKVVTHRMLTTDMQSGGIFCTGEPVTDKPYISTAPEGITQFMYTFKASTMLLGTSSTNTSNLRSATSTSIIVNIILAVIVVILLIIVFALLGCYVKGRPIVMPIENTTWFKDNYNVTVTRQSCSDEEERRSVCLTSIVHITKDQDENKDNDKELSSDNFHLDETNCELDYSNTICEHREKEEVCGNIEMDYQVSIDSSFFSSDDTDGESTGSYLFHEYDVVN
ncbi:hypothetical protein BSL78_00509 [Apostichopus japonicus]|uniref:Uncharacterized protein n=1 Tax=Stichopus japonicus TaxID=307972 RepID=A0A2G8LQT1_STIJA|nr:hypothetical protein BSL78_00509 [Apostichopus japonicus]